MISDNLIRRLSGAQRDVLLAHIDRAVDVSMEDRQLIGTRRTLMGLGLLIGHPGGSIRPRQTTLTNEGHRAVGVLLGDFADALVRAGYLDAPEPEETPLMVLARMKAERTGKMPLFKPEMAGLKVKEASTIAEIALKK